MKVDIDFDSYKHYCYACAEKIQDWGADELVTIMRGGQFASHLISKITKLECGAWWPKHNQLMFSNPENKKIVFIEDTISTGRTYDLLDDMMSNNHPDIEWKIVPLFLDGNVNEKDYPNILTYGFKSVHWVILPYNDRDIMVEGKLSYHRDE